MKTLQWRTGIYIVNKRETFRLCIAKIVPVRAKIVTPLLYRAGPIPPRVGPPRGRQGCQRPCIGGPPKIRAREHGRGAPVLHNLQKTRLFGGWESALSQQLKGHVFRGPPSFFANCGQLKHCTCTQTGGASRQDQYASFDAPSVSGDGEKKIPFVQVHASIVKRGVIPRLLNGSSSARDFQYGPTDVLPASPAPSLG